MMTTRSEPSSRTMVRATSVFPDPDPPAIPIRMRRPVITERDDSIRTRTREASAQREGWNDGGREEEVERSRDRRRAEDPGGMARREREAASRLFLRQLRPCVGVHERGRTRDPADGPPPRVVQRLRPRARG